MNKFCLQFFAEGGESAATDNPTQVTAVESDAPCETKENPTSTDDGATETAEPEEAQADAETLQQLRRIAEGRLRMQAWQEEGERMKEFYPSFSFAEQYNTNEDFAGLVRAGVGVQRAYEVTHLPQILTSAMQYAARKAAEKTANAMYASADRPLENGLSDRKVGLPGEKKVDNLTQADIIRILERVGKGDKITF